MVKFGFITNPANPIEKEIKKAKKLGFDFVEIGIEEPSAMSSILMKKKRKILSLLKKYNLFALGHSLWWTELGSLHEKVRKAWIDECKKIIKISSLLGIKKLNFHTHSRSILVLENKKTKKKVLDNYVESLEELSRYGKKLNVAVMIENAAMKGEITKFEDIKYIAKKTKLPLHLDIGHAFIHGGMKIIEKYIKHFKILHIHIHDNHGKEDEHLPIGKGKINFKKIAKLLKNYDKTITLEIFANEKEIKTSLKKIKKILGKCRENGKC